MWHRLASLDTPDVPLALPDEHGAAGRGRRGRQGRLGRASPRNVGQRAGAAARRDQGAGVTLGTGGADPEVSQRQVSGERNNVGKS